MIPTSNDIAFNALVSANIHGRGRFDDLVDYAIAAEKGTK